MCELAGGDVIVRCADRVASIVSLDAIEERYGDDGYGQSDEWVDERPDLGENAQDPYVPRRI